MNKNDELIFSFVGYAIGFIVLSVIVIFITRAIFSIPQFLKMQKAQVKLLSEIAIKNGVEPDKISGIINEMKS